MEKSFEKVKEIANDTRVAMLTTIDEHGHLHSRPMALNDIEEDGTMWFFTSKFSDKVSEIREESQVNLSFANASSSNYLSIAAKATLVEDQQVINEKYNTFVKAWFPEGTESNKIALLKITPSTAEYWDGAGSKLAQLFKVGAALIKGEAYSGGENETVKM